MSNSSFGTARRDKFCFRPRLHSLDECLPPLRVSVDDPNTFELSNRIDRQKLSFGLPARSEQRRVGCVRLGKNSSGQPCRCAGSFLAERICLDHGQQIRAAFDDVPWMSMVQPAITAVAQPAFEMGRRAALLLLRRLEDPTCGRTVEVLEPRLVTRGSTGGKR